MSKKNIGSNFEDFLKEENLLTETKAVAIKRVLSYQIHKELEKQNCTKSAIAKKMHTSRASLDRLLNATNTSITLKTLTRLANALNKKVELNLV
ncbi:MAG: XRE family transcriptional regulator [Gammaproteobacteria bacterium]